MATIKKTTYINTELEWAEEQLKSWRGKFVQETMKNYLALVEVVDKLRKMEEAKVEVRGKGELGSMAEEFLKNRK